MKQSKRTMRALLTSVLAMLVCLSMLVGSTFAWFTDSASTGTNSIVSGKLDVALVDKDGVSLEGQKLNFVKAEGFETETILWEPGCTYNLPEIYIKNNGNLALKYKIVVTGIEGDAKLLEAIEWTITKDGTAVDLATYEGHLAAGAKDAGALVISGHMKEEAGNAYQGLEASGISITVLATQDTVEHDSIDNQYDKDATYPVVDSAALKTALTKGGIVELTASVNAENANTFEGRNSVTQDTVLNMADSVITFVNTATNDNMTNISALYQMSGGTTLTLNANNGGIDSDFYGVVVGASANAEPDHLIINGGTYKAGSVVQVQHGTVTINGGLFDGRAIYGATGQATFLLNCIDAAYKNGTADIIVTGGTFINFDPNNNRSEGAGTDYVPDGYQVVSETKEDGSIWYTVVPA